MKQQTVILELQRAYSQLFYAQDTIPEARKLLERVTQLITLNRLPDRAILDELTAETRRICFQPAETSAAIAQLGAIADMKLPIGRPPFRVKEVVGDWAEANANARFVVDRIKHYLTNCPEGVTHREGVGDAQALSSLDRAIGLLNKRAGHLMASKAAQRLRAFTGRLETVRDNLEFWLQHESGRFD